MTSCCAEVRDLLQPFLDGELEVERSCTILKHLELCPPCRTRVDGERQLHGLVPRACAEPVDAAARARLLAGCWARCDAEEADAAAAAGRRRRVRWLAAAAVALVGGAALVVAPHARCLLDCPTRRVLAVAHHRASLDAPLPIEQVRACLARSALEPPTVAGLTFVGASPLVLAGEDVGPLLRYRCNCDKTEVIVARLVGGHLHRWQTKRLCDGLDYVALEVEGTRVLAWENPEGGLWCVMGQADRLPQDRLLALASPLRRR